jgi:phytanoyl-CoA hydroxylase
MPSFRNAIKTEFHERIAKALGYQDPRIIQSLIIVKAAEVGAKVVPHQDGCSGFTDPPSCTTFWYALEDATIENGRLAVAPGSHRVQPISRRCRKDETGKAQFVELEEPLFAHIDGASEHVVAERDESGKFVYKKLEVKAGTLVLMHGSLMHTSEANTSKKSRVAFNFGVVEGTHEWPADNYLQPYEGQSEFEKLEG